MRAYGYIRVSGISQGDRDGPIRQQEAIQDYSREHNIELMRVFYDKGVSGATSERDGFIDMVNHIETNPGVSVIIVEASDRLARKVLVQEILIEQCNNKQIKVLSTKEGDLTESDDEVRVMHRQIMGVFAEFDRRRLVKRLRAARDRIRQEHGKCEGRKSYMDKEEDLGTIREIKRLRRKRKGQPRRTYQAIADHLNAKGFETISGRPFNPNIVRQICFKLNHKLFVVQHL